MDTLKKLFLTLGFLSALSLASSPGHLAGQTPEPVVHAVLFFSPTCPHCHQLITEHLIPLQNRYGNRLVILGMDTSQEWAGNLYWEAMRYYQLPEDDWVVPILIVADQVMVGGLEIPERFPAMIEEGLAAGGIDLPNFPALISFLQDQDALDPRYPDRFIMRQAPAQESEPPTPASDSAVSEEEAVADSMISEEPALGDTADVRDSPPAESVPSVSDTPVAGAPPPAGDSARVEGPVAPAGMGRGGGGDSVAPEVPATTPTEQEGRFGLAEAARGMESMTMGERFAMDPTGNSLSVLVLLGMLSSLVLRAYPPRLRGGSGEWPPWVIPVLVLVGAGVAAYLSFIEVTHAEAVCGPVGDCNTVNQSEYAVLFGVLPVGVLGLMGYGVIMVLWVLGHSGSADTSRRATLGLWATALIGTLFSVYLTFLEPFVIGATCAWCLTSAVVMTLLLWSTSPGAARVWPSLHPEPGNL